MKWLWLTPLLSVLAACGSETVTAPAAQEVPAAEPAAEEAPAAEEPKAEVNSPRVFFDSPADGATVTSPFTVKFGVDGMALDPAGEIKEGSGHHHLIINGSVIAQGTVVPADETHIHYGQAQTEAEITLEPGDYTLTMQFANGAHESYGEPMSAVLKVSVAAADAAAEPPAE
jgi:hypothetical protein